MGKSLECWSSAWRVSLSSFEKLEEIKFIHFWGRGGNKSFGNKSCKICRMILFVFHFPAIWLVTLNKPWNLIGCFVLSVTSSLAGKKMQYRAKSGAIWANQITGTTNDFKMDVIKCSQHKDLQQLWPESNLIPFDFTPHDQPLVHQHGWLPVHRPLHN